MRWENLPFKIESEAVRLWYRLSKQRPSSLPYVSGDGFRALADWVYEPATAERFRPESVPSESLGFCDGWVLKDFLRDVAPRISGSFRLISHNADPNLTGDLTALFPGNLETIYSMNKVVAHPRVTAIPIGLENARFHYNGVVRDFDRLRQQRMKKRPRILTAFTVGTNPLVRGQALAALGGLQTVDRIDRINSRGYRKLARGYQFIASPPGNGEDCHRTWEALYLGCIPIVLRSVMAEEFQSRGLPLWIVDSYDELARYDEAALGRRYEELLPGLESPFLWMAPWTNLIQGAKN